MFTNVPWSSYLLFVAFLLAAWYLVIGVRYYFSELQALASGKMTFFRHKAPPEERPEVVGQAAAGHSAADAPPAADMEVLSTRLTGAIASAAAKDFPKEEFIFLLQTILKNFPQLNCLPYRIDVQSLIAAECNKQDFIHLNEDELELLWKA